MPEAKRVWAKASPALIERFGQALPDDARVDRRSMFGYPCAFVNGNLFSGLHEHRLIVRLGEGDRAALVATAGASPCVIMGRAMREYVMIENALDRSIAELSGWMRRGLEHAAALPPKAKKGDAAPAARTATRIASARKAASR